MIWTLRLDDATPSGNILARMHHIDRWKFKREWFYRIRSSKGFLQIPKADGPRRLTVSRHGRAILDTDNLISGLKGIQDNLVQLGMFLDDTPALLILGEPVQTRLKRGEHPHTILLIDDFHTDMVA